MTAFPRVIMRYPTLLLASVVTCLALGACGGNNDSAKSANDAQASADKANAAADKASDKADKASDKADDAASDAHKAEDSK